LGGRSAALSRAITATVWVLVAQVRRGFELPTRHGEGMAQFLGLPANPVALYTFGPDGSLVPGARWFQVGWNLLRWSEDLTKDVWLGSNWVANDATHVTFTAQYGGPFQQIYDDVGSVYTFSAEIRWISGNTNLRIYSAGAEEGNYQPITVTSTLTRYAATATLKSGMDHFNFGVKDINGSGFGQIEMTRAMIIPGSHTAAECAALYQKTEAQQAFHDWSGNGNTASRGSDDEAEDTNDPELTPSSRNLLAPGSTEDLTDTNWTATDANTTATTFTPTAQNGQVVQSFTTTDGADYVLSATISSAGNTSLQWVKGGSTANLTVTATPTRYSTTFTGDGNAWNLGLRDPNASGFGAITFTNIQLETGSTCLMSPH